MAALLANLMALVCFWRPKAFPSARPPIGQLSILDVLKKKNCQERACSLVVTRVSIASDVLNLTLMGTKVLGFILVALCIR